MSLDQLARWRGFGVRRTRGSDRVWLVLDGRLFSPARGHSEDTARRLLAPGNRTAPTP